MDRNDRFDLFDEFDEFDEFGEPEGPVDRLMVQDPLELRARAKNKAPAGRTVFPVEPRQGPWSGNNQLGIPQAFAPDSENRQTILKLDEWGMPQVWTVALGLKDNSLEINPGSLKIQAIVEFGSGGATQTVTLDWKQGTIFSVPMNAINVVAQYQTSSGTADVDIELTVTLSRGASSGFAAPTFSDFLRPPILLISTEIPKFATQVVLLRSDLLSADPFVANVFYNFLGIGGTADVVATVEGNNVLSYGALGIPIPNGSKYMRSVTGGPSLGSVITIFILGGL